MSYAIRYCLIRFCYILSLSFTKTTFYLYLHETQQLPYTDIAFIFLCFDLSVIFLELPTATLGEWFGVRKSFLTGISIKIVASLLFFLGKCFTIFCLAEFFSALALCLISGSLEAWLMHQMGKEKNASTSHIFMLGKRASIVALALGGWSGALLGGIHLGLPWLFVAIGMAISYIIAFFFMNDIIQEESFRKRKYSFSHIIQGYKLTIHNRILFVLLLESFLISFALASPKVVWLPLLKSHFQKNSWFLGNMWLCIQMIQFIGTFGLSSLLKKYSSLLFWKIFFSILSFGFMMGFVFYQNIFPFILFYLLLEWIKPYHHALSLTLVQQETHSTGRVTILSFENLIEKLGNSIGLFLIGSLTLYYDRSIAWCIGFLLYALIIPCYFYCFYKEYKTPTV